MPRPVRYSPPHPPDEDELRFHILQPPQPVDSSPATSLPDCSAPQSPRDSSSHCDAPRLPANPCADRLSPHQRSPVALATRSGTSHHLTGCHPSLVREDDSDSSDSRPNCRTYIAS